MLIYTVTLTGVSRALTVVDITAKRTAQIYIPSSLSFISFSLELIRTHH